MDALLKQLKENARQSAEDLAGMLGLSADDIRGRIAEYERQGIIRGYQAILDEDRIESPERVTAIIEVKVTPEREGGFNRLAMRISRFPEVNAAYLMSGQADLLLFVEGGSLKDVAQFVSEKLATIQGVTATNTAFMLKAYKKHGLLMETQDEYERLKVVP
jgi:DNA-binding Lrp family transcriptional regulator